jgi:hypothetical protein
MHSLKKLYLYIVSIIALVITVIGAIMLLNMALKTWVFTKADDYGRYPVPCSQPATKNPDGSVVYGSDCGPEYEKQQEQAEKDNRTAQKQSQAAQAIAMIVIAGPIWFFHWRMARKEQ